YDANNGTAGVDGVLARLERSSTDPFQLDLSTYIELMRVPQAGRSHGGGTLEFDASGMLVMGIGDGQPGGDPGCTAQDPSNVLGAMLRIDVDGGFPYAIPPDNPFVGVPGHAPEILHFGLRHPWKWDIDEVDGSMWIADVGQAVAEEIDYVPPGAMGLNFGWSVLEGTDCFAHSSGCPGGVETDCASPALTPPAFEYGHGLGFSVTGGAVYRGSLMPEVFGRYFFTDFCSKRIWSIERGSGGFTTYEHPIVRYPNGAILTLAATCGLDADGELILPDFVDGELYRLAPMGAVEPVCDGMPNRTGNPALLSFTGSTSYAASDVRLRVDQAPPLSLSVLFYGFDEGSQPLGNGVLCVAPNPGPLVRVDYRLSDAQGVIQYDVESDDDAFLFGGVTVGTTCVFQSWYRDVSGPLGFDTNTSGAVSVRFRP
ncbi:MAG: PQQ-dependent sugar dehydrogenase, partial [Planctomycetota bacterium]